MTPEEIVQRAVAGVQRAVQYCDDVEFSPEDAPPVREAILAGLDFQLQTLFQPETLMYLPKMELIS